MSDSRKDFYDNLKKYNIQDTLSEKIENPEDIGSNLNTFSSDSRINSDDSLSIDVNRVNTTTLNVNKKNKDDDPVDVGSINLIKQDEKSPYFNNNYYIDSMIIGSLKISATNPNTSFRTHNLTIIKGIDKDNKELTDDDINNSIAHGIFPFTVKNTFKKDSSGNDIIDKNTHEKVLDKSELIYNTADIQTSLTWYADDPKKTTMYVTHKTNNPVKESGDASDKTNIFLFKFDGGKYGNKYDICEFNETTDSNGKTVYTPICEEDNPEPFKCIAGDRDINNNIRSFCIPHFEEVNDSEKVVTTTN